MNRNQMVAILSALDAAVNEKQLMNAFALGDVSVLLQHAEESGYLEKQQGSMTFHMPREKIARQGITPDMLLQPVYSFWDGKTVGRAELERCRIRMQESLLFSYEECVVFFNRLGAFAEKRKNLFLATTIYMEMAVCAREAIPSARKALFVCAVRGISRVEFMCGLSSLQALSYQHEALNMIHQANLTAEDALLMLYTGMNEHFCGSIEEGYSLREKGIKYLEQFSCDDVESEAMPLIGYHYSEVGNYAKTIAYYESMILAIENRKDSDIIAFAYPPIIFSYTFLGEYYRALILAKILYNKALEFKNHNVATLMLSLIGRTYVYMDDIERGETVLYQAYAEALQQDYGWGLYYTLLGISYLQLKKENYFASREALFLANKAAREHHFSSINASPFVLDTLKMIEDKGLEPIEGFDYRTELHKVAVSANIHMAGVAYRHMAVLDREAGKNPEEVLRSLQFSVKYLEESGNGNQLGLTYLEYARVFRDLNDEPNAKKYAQLACSVQTEEERKRFPGDLSNFVETKDYQVALPVLLDTAWLEFRHIINPERLIARLLTTICRQLKTESGVFVLVRDGKYNVILAQNIERKQNSAQYQRVMAIVSQVVGNSRIFTTQNKQLALWHQNLDLHLNPRFIACIPFLNGKNVGAALYLESYYKENPLTDEECDLLTDFAKKLSEHLFATLSYEKVSADSGIVDSNAEIITRLSGHSNFCPSIDESILQIQAQITKIAKTKAPVLITGETGAGKEIFCSEIFEKSECTGPFVKVNCGAIPESLIESELFGYERGSFTGATQQKKGYFELADGGTLFLDEIGELALQTQVKLLRVLQEHEFIRVGGTKAIKVDFRLIAATNKDLQQEVEAGMFRKDLYYRLNVLQLEIPPLRERKVDITNMARYFVDKFCREIGRKPCQISPETLVSLLEYDWPGNVRELENTIQRAVLLTENDVIVGPLVTRVKSVSGKAEKMVMLEEVERRYILQVLRACNGKIGGSGGAAEILGLKRTTLNFRMGKLGIKNAKLDS